MLLPVMTMQVLINVATCTDHTGVINVVTCNNHAGVINDVTCNDRAGVKHSPLPPVAARSAV